MTGNKPQHGTNQGEGNRDAARAYNKDTTEFAHSGKADKAARDAAKAVAGQEGEALRQAEEKGRSHSHGEDPAVKR
jgi:hypothetical protein